MFVLIGQVNSRLIHFEMDIAPDTTIVAAIYNIFAEYSAIHYKHWSTGFQAAVNGDTEVLGPFSTSTQTDHFVPDTQKLRELGWQPKVDMQACIRRCLESTRQRK